MFADWLNASGLAMVKPLLTALALPPASLFALVLAGAWAARARPRSGRLLVLLGCALLWLDACNGSADWMEHHLLHESPALTAADRAELASRHAAGAKLAIVVLGGGVEPDAPEYGSASLKRSALPRLRYGAWLARRTGIPLAASGGLGWAAVPAATPSEAELMARIAHDEFGQTIRWQDTTSRDTHENALHSVAMLDAAGIHEVLVVTDSWHMPRALREFDAAAASHSPAMTIRAAPIGPASSGDQALLDWLPSGDGALRVRAVLRELAGLWLVAPHPHGP